MTAFHNHSLISVNAAELPWCNPDEDLSNAVSKYEAKHGIIFATVQSGKIVLAVQQPSIITQHGSMKYSRSTGAERRKSMGI